MLAQTDPYDAYQRVEFDARVKGATSSELVHVCYDQLILALSTALVASERRDARLKSRSLTRALTALMALQLGVDQGHEMAAVLTDFYGAARKSILASSLEFDAECLRVMRDDFWEIRDAMLHSGG
ncbi:MAG: flagellar protein FliS [Novosphingobium sp.]|nr:flagellar protein FliS [Novosphingobium sp.]